MGNQATVEVSFKVIKPAAPEDRHSPEVEMDELAGAGYFEVGERVDIAGLATDDIGVVKLEVEEDFGGTWTDITVHAQLEHRWPEAGVVRVQVPGDGRCGQGRDRHCVHHAGGPGAPGPAGHLAGGRRGVRRRRGGGIHRQGLR